MNNQKFSFKFVSLNEILNRVKNSNPKKVSQATDITTKLLQKIKTLYHCKFFLISTIYYQVPLFQLN